MNQNKIHSYLTMGKKKSKEDPTTTTDFSKISVSAISSANTTLPTLTPQPPQQPPSPPSPPPPPEHDDVKANQVFKLKLLLVEKERRKIELQNKNNESNTSLSNIKNKTFSSKGELGKLSVVINSAKVRRN